MVYGGGGENICRLQCEICKEWILENDIITTYGPEEHMSIYGDIRQKPHYICRVCELMDI